MAKITPGLSDLDFIRWAHIRLDTEYRKTFDEYKKIFRKRLVTSEDGIVTGIRMGPSNIPSSAERELFDKFKEEFRLTWDLVVPIDYRDLNPKGRLRFFQNVPAQKIFTGRLPHQKELMLGINLTYSVEAILSEVDKIVREEIRHSTKPHLRDEKVLERKDTRKHRHSTSKWARAYELREYSRPKLTFKEVAKRLTEDYPSEDPDKGIDEKTAQLWHSKFQEAISSRSYMKKK